ncbi:MAG: ABC transporter ATP-binding protein [Pirellulales bacterium]
MIQLSEVSKVYRQRDGEVRALDAVSLKIESGEFVAVRGPSGCGKSTLLSLIGGLASPSSGRVIVSGQDWAALSPATRARFRARQIGFVFQMFHLLPYLTVLDNVLVAAVAGDGAARPYAAELLDRFQLSGRLGHRPAELSIGERQRVAMARALVNRPQLILADEPTGNLDSANAVAVFELLGDFHRSGGTVLLVTHAESASTYAGRTILLENGTVVSA